MWSRGPDRWKQGQSPAADTPLHALRGFYATSKAGQVQRSPPEVVSGRARTRELLSDPQAWASRPLQATPWGEADRLGEAQSPGLTLHGARSRRLAAQAMGSVRRAPGSRVGWSWLQVPRGLVEGDYAEEKRAWDPQKPGQPEGCEVVRKWPLPRPQRI